MQSGQRAALDDLVAPRGQQVAGRIGTALPTRAAAEHLSAAVDRLERADLRECHAGAQRRLLGEYCASSNRIASCRPPTGLTPPIGPPLEQCIASNGVQPGVSKRISIAVDRCRASSDADAPREPCESPHWPDEQHAAHTSTEQPQRAPATIMAPARQSAASASDAQSGGQSQVARQSAPVAGSGRRPAGWRQNDLAAHQSLDRRRTGSALNDNRRRSGELQRSLERPFGAIRARPRDVAVNMNKLCVFARPILININHAH